MRRIIVLCFILLLLVGCTSSGTAGIRIQAKRARVPYQGIRTIECDDCDIHIYHARSNCEKYKEELQKLDTLQDEITDIDIKKQVEEEIRLENEEPEDNRSTEDNG